MRGVIQICHSVSGLCVVMCLCVIQVLCSIHLPVDTVSFRQLNSLKQTDDKEKFGTFQSSTHDSSFGITEREADVKIVMNFYMRALDCSQEVGTDVYK